MTVWGWAAAAGWLGVAAVLDRKHPQLEFETTLSERFRALPYWLRRALRLVVALGWPLLVAAALVAAVFVLAIDAYESSRKE